MRGRTLFTHSRTSSPTRYCAALTMVSARMFGSPGAACRYLAKLGRSSPPITSLCIPYGWLRWPRRAQRRTPRTPAAGMQAAAASLHWRLSARKQPDRCGPEISYTFPARLCKQPISRAGTPAGLSFPVPRAPRSAEVNSCGALAPHQQERLITPSFLCFAGSQLILMLIPVKPDSVAVLAAGWWLCVRHQQLDGWDKP